MKINSILTIQGDSIELGDLTVLVGPNNSGKSRTLLDIVDIFEAGYNSTRILIDRLVFEEISFEDFRNGLNIVTNPKDERTHLASGLTITLNDPHSSGFRLNDLEANIPILNKNGWQNICNMGLGRLKLTFLNSDRRLNLANQIDLRGGSETPRTPLEKLYEELDVEKHLNDAFEKAFSNEIKLDATLPARLVFKVTKKFPELPSDSRKARPLMKPIPRLDDQGDGYRSFVGIILGIILSEGRIVLIDEPEAFLHPTQARVLGEWIASYSTLKNIQVVIATHSSDVLEGILTKNESTNIFRVNRKENDTRYIRISSDITSKLAKMPLISSQPILESIFYGGVIICEGDTDRVIYKAVYSNESKKRELLFVDSFGKQAMKKIIEPLKAAHIPVCVIADIDILNSEKDFKELLLAFDSSKDFSQLITLRGKIQEEIEGESDEEILKNLEINVQKFLKDFVKEEKHDLRASKKTLERIAQSSTKWKQAKKNGVEGIPKNVRDDCKKILEEAKHIGLFIPEVGELESWFGISKNHEAYLEKINEIEEGKAPKPLKSFINDIINYLEK